MTTMERPDDDTIGMRLSGFLKHWTAPLLSGPEQKELLELFGMLTAECLSGCDSAARWDSDLTTDGVPVEFSCVVDPAGTGSVRFIVDSQAGPQDRAKAQATIRRHAGLVVPRSESSSGLTELLVDRHLAEVPDFSRSYVGFGARFAPGKPRAGRLYFKTWWTSFWNVYWILSELLENEGFRRFRSSFLGQERIQGVAYDFNHQGLARVKLYVWAGSSPMDTVRALATDLPGLRKAPLDELVALVAQAAPDSAVCPPVLLGVGFAPESDYCDLKVSFSASEWEWGAFNSLIPVLTPVLEYWGLPADFETAGNSSAPPWWRFVPTWISIDASPKGESLSVYLKPCRMSLEGLDSFSGDSDPRGTGLAHEGRSVFGMMFSQLLECEASANCAP